MIYKLVEGTHQHLDRGMGRLLLTQASVAFFVPLEGDILELTQARVVEVAHDWILVAGTRHRPIAGGLGEIASEQWWTCYFMEER